MLAVSALLTLVTLNDESWGGAGVIINTVFGLTFIGLCVLVPIVIAILMLIKWHFLKSPSFVAKYGALYHGLDMTKKSIIVYRLTFFLRRLIIAISITCTDKLAYQLILFFSQEMIFMAVIGIGEPFESS